MRGAACSLLLLLAAGIPTLAPRGQRGPVMPHLLLPHWTPTYNLTRSTMTQTCWATYGPETYRIKDSDAAWMRQWGLLSLDFESNEKIWHTMHPEDINAVQVDMAAQMKRLAPDTRVFTCACHHAVGALCQLVPCGPRPSRPQC